MTDQKQISLVQWCAYLPYGIEIKHEKFERAAKLTAAKIENMIDNPEFAAKIKPLLRPMNKENQAAINDICSKYNLSFDDCFWREGLPYGDEASFEIVTTEELPYGLVQELLQNHYDLDGLIPQGLAVPIE